MSKERYQELVLKVTNAWKTTSSCAEQLCQVVLKSSAVTVQLRVMTKLYGMGFTVIMTLTFVYVLWSCNSHFHMFDSCFCTLQCIKELNSKDYFQILSWPWDIGVETTHDFMFWTTVQMCYLLIIDWMRGLESHQTFTYTLHKVLYKA